MVHIYMNILDHGEDELFYNNMLMFYICRSSIYVLAKSGRKERGPCVSTRFSLGVENERDDARRDS